MASERPVDGLKDLLSHHMNNSAYDPSAIHEGRWLIDHLIEQVTDWEMGGTDTPELKAAFDQVKDQLNGFDIMSWLQEKHAEGVYDDPLAPQEDFDW